MRTHFDRASTASLPIVAGKFIWSGGRKLYVRGVTYGTFRPDPTGDDYPAQHIVERDFASMAAAGMNAVRTFTVPPQRLLDAAGLHGLRVMVGVPWEQHITFLGEMRRERDIRRRLQAAVRACAGHPAILGYAIGNEIPAGIVRWHGPNRIERFLETLYDVAKTEAPGGLVTYVNYPTTEYLELPFLDFVSFNVYLESQNALSAYLARLQTLAGERPLVLTEIGLDGRRNGAEAQARALDWQIRSAFSAGCAGVFIFGWTDEWHRGGYDIEDWGFGLTDDNRRAKPALAAVTAAFRDVPFPRDRRWPRVSVIVCSCNGARTIRDCFDALRQLTYPDYEVIVVNDGSTDNTAAIAREYGFRLIDGNNHGLSAARNAGLALASGEVVAYIDDDAYPDPDWLTYLVATLLDTSHLAVGGPNIAPLGESLVAQCVANAPGGPSHVLLSEHEAEHVPGCNLAIRKTVLEAIGGFDPQFGIAGDDVDVCWRLQQYGATLGFSPAATVWHHCRSSVRAFWKQQENYGHAEALLEKKWPEKYNRTGQLVWAGRLYSSTFRLSVGRTNRIYHGVWGLAPFQSVRRDPPGLLQWLPAIPETYLLLVVLAALAALGMLWPPLLFAWPLLVFIIGALIYQAVSGARHAVFNPPPRSRLASVALHTVTAFLHLIQPLARLRGRLRGGFSPWRHRRMSGASIPLPRTFAIWSERWKSPEAWLQEIERLLRSRGGAVRRGGECDRWDLEITGGTLAGVRLLMVTEEHGASRQFVKFRVWPRCSPAALAIILALGALAATALVDHARAVAATLGAAGLLLVLRIFREWAAASSAARDVLVVRSAALAEPSTPPQRDVSVSDPAELASGESV